MFPWRPVPDRTSLPVMSLTVLETVHLFLTSRVARGEYAPSTRRQSYHALTSFGSTIGNPPLREVSRRQVDHWLETRDACQRTRRNYLVVLRAFFAWCVDEGHIYRSPLAGMKMPPVVRTLPRQLRPDEVRRIVEACPDSRARFMVLAMFQLGLRCCEVASLDWSGIDLSAGTVHITGKAGHQRLLPLVQEAADALEDYWAEVGLPPQGRVVRSMNDPDRALLPNTVSTLVSRIFQASGVKRGRYDGRSAHACRHTAAGDVLRRGGHLRDIQMMLGHQSLQTTQAYLPLLVGDLREVMEGRSYKTPPPDAA